MKIRAIIFVHCTLHTHTFKDQLAHKHFNQDYWCSFLFIVCIYSSNEMSIRMMHFNHQTETAVSVLMMLVWKNSGLFGKKWCSSLKKEKYIANAAQINEKNTQTSNGLTKRKKNGCNASYSVWPHRFKEINWSKGTSNEWKTQKKKHHNHHVLEYKLYLADILCTIVSSLKTQKVACMWSNKALLA